MLKAEEHWLRKNGMLERHYLWASPGIMCCEASWERLLAVWR